MVVPFLMTELDVESRQVTMRRRSERKPATYTGSRTLHRGREVQIIIRQTAWA